MLKKKSKAGGENGPKPKSDNPFDGIDDFSELAAVFDYYEVRNRTGGANSGAT